MDLKVLVVCDIDSTARDIEALIDSEVLNVLFAKSLFAG